MAGPITLLEGFYTTEVGKHFWNADLVVEGTMKPFTLHMDLYGKSAHDGKQVTIRLDFLGATAVHTSVVDANRITIDMPSNASKFGVTSTDQGTTTEDVLKFYKAGIYTYTPNKSNTTPQTAFSFYLNIYGTVYKFSRAVPPTSNGSICTIQPPSSTSTSSLSALCDAAIQKSQLVLDALTDPVVVPPYSPPSSPGGSSSRPSSPGKTTKDPPGQNVMLVVLLLGAVLALSNCMPCK